MLLYLLLLVQSCLFQDRKRPPTLTIMAEQGEEESYEQEFNFAVNIVRLAGEIIRQAFFKDKSITEKTCHNDLGKLTSVFICISYDSDKLEHFIWNFLF